MTQDSNLGRKTKIDFKAIHSARRKMYTGDPLKKEERQAVAKLIEKAEKVFYPGKMEYERYQAHLQQLEKTDPQAQPGVAENLRDSIRNFEQKFC